MVTIEYIKNLILNGEDISDIDYSHITDMSYMFANNDFITFIPDFDTSHVTNMEGMFFGCRNLKASPLLDTSNVTNMKYMFKGCLELIDIFDIDTSNATTIEGIFSDCSSLKYIPNLNLSNVINADDMLHYCFEARFDMSSWKINEDLNILKMINNAFSSENEFYDCLGLDLCVKIIIENHLSDPFFEKALMRNNYTEAIKGKLLMILKQKLFS